MAINVDKILADKVFLEKIFDEMKAFKSKRGYDPLEGWEGSIKNPNLELGNNWDLLMEYLSDAIRNSNNVGCFDWDGGGIPGSSGAIYYYEYFGKYFLTSSDYEDEGPFDTQGEAELMHRDY